MSAIYPNYSGTWNKKKLLRTEIEQDSDKNKLGVVECRCEEVSSDGK